MNKSPFILYFAIKLVFTILAINFINFNLKAQNTETIGFDPLLKVSSLSIYSTINPNKEREWPADSILEKYYKISDFGKATLIEKKYEDKKLINNLYYNDLNILTNEELFYEDDPKLILINAIYKYNKKGELISSEKSIKDLIKNTQKFKYNSNGQLVRIINKMQGKSPKTTWFKYNDMDSLKSEILYSEDNKPAVIIEYKYPNENTTIKTTTLSESSKYLEDQIVFGKLETFYSNKKKISEVYESFDKKVVATIKYNYDNPAIIFINSDFKGKNEGEHNTNIVEIKYLLKNGLLRRIEKYENGILFQSLNYHYTYYN